MIRSLNTLEMRLLFTRLLSGRASSKAPLPNSQIDWSRYRGHATRIQLRRLRLERVKAVNQIVVLVETL